MGIKKLFYLLSFKGRKFQREMAFSVINILKYAEEPQYCVWASIQGLGVEGVFLESIGATIVGPMGLLQRKGGVISPGNCPQIFSHAGCRR